MDLGQKIFIQQLLNLSMVTDAEFYTALASFLQVNDCVHEGHPGVNLPIRSHYMYTLSDRGCALIGQCPTPVCEDTSCILDNGTCLLYCAKNGYSWNYQNTTREECLSDVYCNWNVSLCDGLSLDNCTEACTNSDSTYFCGICENGEDCTEIPGLTYLSVW
jgi:hypothetical protein